MVGGQMQGLSQKMPVQNSNSKIPADTDLATILLIPTTFNSLLCQKSNLHFSYVLKDGLVGKYLVITLKKSKLKIPYRNSCLSKKEVFRKLPVLKTGRTDPGQMLICQ